MNAAYRGIIHYHQILPGQLQMACSGGTDSIATYQISQRTKSAQANVLLAAPAGQQQCISAGNANGILRDTWHLSFLMWHCFCRNQGFVSTYPSFFGMQQEVWGMKLEELQISYFLLLPVLILLFSDIHLKTKGPFTYDTWMGKALHWTAGCPAGLPGPASGSLKSHRMLLY